MSYLKGKNEEKTLHRSEVLYCLLSVTFKRRHRTNKKEANQQRVSRNMRVVCEKNETVFITLTSFL